jgi:hypothetical protein
MVKKDGDSGIISKDIVYTPRNHTQSFRDANARGNVCALRKSYKNFVP